MGTWSREAAPPARSCRSLRRRRAFELRVPSDDGVSGSDDGPVSVKLAGIVGEIERREHPPESAGLHFAERHVHELGKDRYELARAPGAHPTDHLHVPQLA